MVSVKPGESAVQVVVTSSGGGHLVAAAVFGAELGQGGWERGS